MQLTYSFQWSHFNAYLQMEKEEAVDNDNGTHEGENREDDIEVKGFRDFPHLK